VPSVGVVVGHSRCRLTDCAFLKKLQTTNPCALNLQRWSSSSAACTNATDQTLYGLAAASVRVDRGAGARFSNGQLLILRGQIAG
jgi:hypothetical protein